MTQPELVKKYISEFGFIVPAKCIGRNYGGGFFGAELSRVCRKLREEGVLISRPEGKFEKYFYKSRIVLPPAFAPKEIKKEQKPNLFQGFNNEDMNRRKQMDNVTISFPADKEPQSPLFP